MLDSLQRNKQLAVLGFGELAHQILNFIDVSQESIQIFDDHLVGKKTNALPFSNYLQHLHNYEWIVALGYKHLNKKLELAQVISAQGAKLKSFIHPTCFKSESCVINDGVVIYPMCNLDKGVQIGQVSILNNSVIVSHDSVIGAANYISPGVIISGNVSIGNCCFIGAGSIITNGITIGNNVTIGAGTLVTQNLPSNSYVIGNPMAFKKNLNLS